MAAVLACGPAALLSHRSAAALWGIAPARPAGVDRCRRRVRPLDVPGIRVHRRRALSRAPARGRRHPGDGSGLHAGRPCCRAPGLAARARDQRGGSARSGRSRRPCGSGRPLRPRPGMARMRELLGLDAAHRLGPRAAVPRRSFGCGLPTPETQVDGERLSGRLLLAQTSGWWSRPMAGAITARQASSH